MEKTKWRILLGFGVLTTLTTTGSVVLSCGSSHLNPPTPDISDQQKLNSITTQEVADYVKTQDGFIPSATVDVPTAAPSTTLTNATLNGLGGLTITISNWAANATLGSVTFDVNISKTRLIAKDISGVTYDGWITDQKNLDSLTAQDVKAAVSLWLKPTSKTPIVDAPENYTKDLVFTTLMAKVTFATWIGDITKGSITFSIKSISKDSGAIIDGSKFGLITLDGFLQADTTILTGDNAQAEENKLWEYDNATKILTINYGVTEIGTGNTAIPWTTLLIVGPTNINLPNTLHRIGNFAFNEIDTTKETELSIPASVQIIDASAFATFYSLSSLKFLGAVPSASGRILNLGANSFQNTPVTNIVAGDSGTTQKEWQDWAQLPENIGAFQDIEQTRINTITQEMVANYVKKWSLFTPSIAADVPKTAPSDTIFNATLNGVDGLTITISNWAANATLGSVTFDVNISKTGFISKSVTKVTYDGWKSLDSLTAQDIKVAVSSWLNPTSITPIVDAPENYTKDLTFGALTATVTFATWIGNSREGSITFSIKSISNDTITVDGSKFGSITLDGFLKTDTTILTGENAFDEKGRLWEYDNVTQTLTINYGVTEVGITSLAIPWNKLLQAKPTNISLPSTLVKIGVSGFESMVSSEVVELTIPASIQTIEANAFATFFSLSSIKFLGVIPSASGRILTLGANSFKNTPISNILAGDSGTTQGEWQAWAYLPENVGAFRT